MQSPERHKLSMAALLANRRYLGRITVAELAEIVEKSGDICYWCKKTNLSGRDLTFEHLEPENRKDCIVVACRPCNAKRQQRREHAETRQAKYQRNWREGNRKLNKCVRAAETANAKYPGRITADDLLGVIDRCKGICHWCHKENLQAGDLTFEHLQPINAVEHIVIACVSCNAAKFSHGKLRRTPEEKHQAELEQKRRHRLETVEQRAVYRRKYYDAHAEAIKAKEREYYAAHKDKMRPAKIDYDHQRYLERKAQRIAQVKQWRIDNREKYLAMKHQEYQRRKVKELTAYAR